MKPNLFSKTTGCARPDPGVLPPNYLETNDVSQVVIEQAGKYGTDWSENEYVVVREAYELVGPCPPHGKRNQFVKRLAELLGRTPDSILMKLQNYAFFDPDARKRFGRKFLSAKWHGDDDHTGGKYNKFYFRMPIDSPGVYMDKLKTALKATGIVLLPGRSPRLATPRPASSKNLFSKMTDGLRQSVTT